MANTPSANHAFAPNLDAPGWVKLTAILGLLTALLGVMIPIIGVTVMTTASIALCCASLYGRDFRNLAFAAAFTNILNLIVSPTTWFIIGMTAIMRTAHNEGFRPPSDGGYEGMLVLFWVLGSIAMIALIVMKVTNRDPALYFSSTSIVTDNNRQPHQSTNTPVVNNWFDAVTEPQRSDQPREQISPASETASDSNKFDSSSSHFYRAEINREQPTCIIFVVDQSGSMDEKLATGKTKAAFVADALNRTLYSLIVTCTKADGIRHYFDIAVIGYNNNTATPGLNGALAKQFLHPIFKIGENPLRVEDRARLDDDGAGGVVERKVKFPIWFEPKSDGGTPMRLGLSEARKLVATWCAEHPKSYPPTIIHVTDGDSTDGNPGEIAASIQTIGTSDGPCLLFNIHVSTEVASSTAFPSRSAALTVPLARQLFEMSSILHTHIAARASEKGYRLETGARGYVFNADPKDIVNFFDIGTRPRIAADR